MTAPPTRQEQHERLFDTFVKEMFVDPEIPKRNKSSGGLCKRAKFLSKKENLKGPNDVRVEMPPLSRKPKEVRIL